MPIVKAKCTNCGGSLEVDTEKKAAICPYCHEAYVVEDAVNNYITNIGHLHADSVTINDSRSADARIEAGEASLLLRNWEQAENAFKEVCVLTPQDYRGWWGQIRAATHNFSIDLIHSNEIDTLNHLYRGVSQFLTGPDRPEIEQTFENYISRVTEINRKSRDTLLSRIEQLRSQIVSLREEADKLEKTILTNSDWPLRSGSFLGNTLPWVIIAGIALSLFGIPAGFLLIGVSLATYIIVFIRNIVVRNIRRKTVKEKESVTLSTGKASTEKEQYENALKMLNDSSVYFSQNERIKVSKVLEEVLAISGK